MGKREFLVFPHCANCQKYQNLSSYTPREKSIGFTKVFKKSEISWFENSEKLTLVPGAYMKHVDKNNLDLILVICTSRDIDVTVLESLILGQGGVTCFEK